MRWDSSAYYRALRSRDERFDGVFFVGVRTTGIYCRPICPARTPRRSRCEFFTRAAEAERAGYRACFRCRPELSPGRTECDSLVGQAAARIEAGYLNDHTIEELAASLHVTSRHLRRVMELELGVTPVELAQTRRLAISKQLLHDTSLALTDVAFASGFSSVRRFNALFRSRFGRPPSAVRREHGKSETEDSITVRLDYRPPLNFPALLGFLGGRAIPGVETVDGCTYRRTVALGDRSGSITVTQDLDRASLRAEISHSLLPSLVDIVSRLRALFDLNAEPDRISEHLRRDPLLRASCRRRPGLRVPGAFDGFELAIRCVLGQQISVAAATTISGRFVREFGEALTDTDYVFPSPTRIADASIASIRSIGLPEARARSIKELAREIASRTLDLGPGPRIEDAIAALRGIPGIGPWSAQYIAMRALRSPNAFPAGDLVIRRALGVKTDRAAEHRAENWQPWRAYAAMHLWSSYAQGG